MLGKLLATPNLTKSRENAKLNSFLQDVRSKRRSGFEDYVIEVGSKIGRLDFKISRFLGGKTERNWEGNEAAEKKMAFCPL